MKRNKVLEFANKTIDKNKEASWTRIAIGNMRPSVDPNTVPLYIVDVQGMRGDGVVFKVPVYINKQKIDLVPVNEAIRATVELVNNGVQKLLEFSGCGCNASSECEKHKRELIH